MAEDNVFNLTPGSGGINNPANQEAGDGAEIIGVLQGNPKVFTDRVRYSQEIEEKTESKVVYSGMKYVAPAVAKFAKGDRVVYRGQKLGTVLSASVNPQEGANFYEVHIDGTPVADPRNTDEPSLVLFDASGSSQPVHPVRSHSFYKGQDVVWWTGAQGQHRSPQNAIIIAVYNSGSISSPDLEYQVQMTETGNVLPFVVKSMDLTARFGNSHNQGYNPPPHGRNQTSLPGALNTTNHHNYLDSPPSGPMQHGSSPNAMQHLSGSMASPCSAQQVRPVFQGISPASQFQQSLHMPDFEQRFHGRCPLPASRSGPTDASRSQREPSLHIGASVLESGRRCPGADIASPTFSPAHKAQPVYAQTRTPDGLGTDATPLLTPLHGFHNFEEVDAQEIPQTAQPGLGQFVQAPIFDSDVPMPGRAAGRVATNKEVQGDGALEEDGTPDVSYRRTMNAMRAESTYDLLPDDTNGIPDGPFTSISDLDYALTCWAGDQHKCDRGFSIIKGGDKNANKKGPRQHGERKRFICKQCREACKAHNLNVTDKKDKMSPFECVYEYCKEGWYFYRATAPHAPHPFKTDVMQVRIDPNSRCMPEEIAVLARDMASQGKDASCIMDVLAGSAKRLKVDVTWNIEYIRTHFVLNTTSKLLDATDLVSLLRTRKDNQGLEYYFDVDGDLMTRCFVQMENSFDEWASGGKFNVLFVDATHGTNQAGLKLCCFTTISSTGQTVILAFGLIRHEDATSYEWMFRRFHDIFKVRPLVMFTDSAIEIAIAYDEVNRLDDAATNAGIDDIWTETLHFLCTYHISKNLHSNCHGFFTGNPAGWRRFCNKFWRICLQTDVRTQDGIHQDLTDLETIMTNECNIDEDADGKPHSGLKWLRQTLTVKYKQWAARFTWSYLTHGAHSSQRAESIHKAIKRRIHRGLRVTELVGHLIDYNLTSRDRKEVDVVLKMMKAVASTNADLPPYLQHLIKPVMQITPYALNHLLAQYAQVRYYASGESIVFSPILKTEPYLQRLNEQHFMDLKHELHYTIFAEDEETSPYGYMATYHLSRLGHESAVIPADDEASAQHDTIGDTTVACDFGLHEGPEFDLTPNRKCNMYWCSCQLDSALNLPCRHQLWCWEEKQRNSTKVLEFPLACIGAKWKIISHHEQIVMSNALRDVGKTEDFLQDAQPGHSNDVYRVPYSVPPNLRYKLIMRECTTLAEMGTGKEDTFNRIRSGIRELVRIASVPTTTPKLVATRKETAAINRLPADQASMKELLGCQLEVVPFLEAKPLVENLHGFAGTDEEVVDIAIKYAGKTRGNWAVGSVYDLDSDDEEYLTKSSAQRMIGRKSHRPNYKVTYKDLNSETDMYEDKYEYEFLELEDYCTTGLTENVEKYKWCLLRNKPAGATDDQLKNMIMGSSRKQTQKRKISAGDEGKKRKR